MGPRGWPTKKRRHHHGSKRAPKCEFMLKFQFFLWNGKIHEPQIIINVTVSEHSRGAVTNVPFKIIEHFRKISYLRTSLKPNKRISVTLSAEDVLKNKFQVTDEFKTDASGKSNFRAAQCNPYRTSVPSIFITLMQNFVLNTWLKSYDHGIKDSRANATL